MELGFFRPVHLSAGLEKFLVIWFSSLSCYIFLKDCLSSFPQIENKLPDCCCEFFMSLHP